MRTIVTTIVLVATLAVTATPSQAIGCAHPCILGSDTGSGITDGLTFVWEGTFTGVRYEGSRVVPVTWSFAASGQHEAGTPERGTGSMRLYTGPSTAPEVHHQFDIVVTRTDAGWVFTSAGKVPEWAGNYFGTRGRYSGALVHHDGA